ncbi:MAG TPA: hypothetical protein VNI20_14200 [Fimbriimonadaceae bacterium]|nr:hypothetical protein [Fimbriimonadaceae bacterium]
MDNKAGLNWRALWLGYTVVLVLGVLALPATRWIPTHAWGLAEQGRADLWAVSKSEIKGDSYEAQLARALTGNSYIERIDSLRKVVDAKPDRIEGVAILCRYMCMKARQDNSDLNAVRELIDEAEKGEKLAPENAYFPLVIAGASLITGDHGLFAQAIHRSASATDYKDYGLYEASVVTEQLVKNRGSISNTQKAGVYFSVAFAHLSVISQIRREPELLSDQERADAIRAMFVMAAKGDTVITQIVAQGVTAFSLLPGAKGAKQKPKRSEYEAAAKALAESIPGFAGSVDHAVRLADRDNSATNKLLDEDTDAFQAQIDGRYLYWYLASHLWLALSVVAVLVSPWIFALSGTRYVRLLAMPMCVIAAGLMIVSSTINSVSGIDFWYRYAPYAIALGIAGGLMMQFDKTKRSGSVLCLVVGVVLAPAVYFAPVLLAPYVIALALIVIGDREVPARLTEVVAGLAPCLIIAPFALSYVIDISAEIVPYAILVVLLILPVLGLFRVSRRKKWPIAISLALPCLVATYCVWVNVSMDASLAGFLQGDSAVVKQLQDAGR